MLLISIARNELDDILDGFVWGAMVGVGFLLVEDVFYFVRAFAETGSLFAVVQMFLIRIVGAGPYSHFLYTGLVGMGMAYVVVRRGPADVDAVADRRRAHRGRGRGALPVELAVPDRAAGQRRPAELGDLRDVKGLPMLIGLVLVVRLARNRERRWFASLASGFHDDGAITPEEIAGARRRPGPAGGAERRGARKGPAARRSRAGSSGSSCCWRWRSTSTGRRAPGRHAAHGRGDVAQGGSTRRSGPLPSR